MAWETHSSHSRASSTLWAWQNLIKSLTFYFATIQQNNINSATKHTSWLMSKPCHYICATKLEVASTDMFLSLTPSVSCDTQSLTNYSVPPSLKHRQTKLATFTFINSKKLRLIFQITNCISNLYGSRHFRDRWIDDEVAQRKPKTIRRSRNDDSSWTRPRQVFTTWIYL